MADHEIKYPEVFDESLRKFETTDKAHADVFNDVINVLINNDVFLKKLAEEIKTKSDNHIATGGIHVTDAQKTSWTNKAEKTVATTSANGLMSAADKTKINAVASGAEVNQNAFSNVKVGSTTVAANAKTATVELVAGVNITLTPDNATKKVTIAAKDTVYTHPSTKQCSGGEANTIGGKTATGTLNTTEKTNLVTAINQCFQLANDGKSNIAKAINAKGVSATSSENFSSLATKITNSLAKKQGTAIASDTLSGKTFVNSTGNLITGNMVNRGNVTGTITSQNGTYTIASGYHAGGGKVTANISNLTAENIKKGVNVGGVVGTYQQSIVDNIPLNVKFPNVYNSDLHSIDVIQLRTTSPNSATVKSILAYIKLNDNTTKNILVINSNSYFLYKLTQSDEVKKVNTLTLTGRSDPYLPTPEIVLYNPEMSNITFKYTGEYDKDYMYIHSFIILE